MSRSVPEVSGPGTQDRGLGIIGFRMWLTSRRGMDLMSWPKRRGAEESPPSPSSVWSDLPLRVGPWAGTSNKRHVARLSRGPCVGSEITGEWRRPGPRESWAGSQQPSGALLGATHRICPGVHSLLPGRGTPWDEEGLGLAQKPTGISLMSWAQARWWAAPQHRGYSWAPGLGPLEKLLLLSTPALSMSELDFGGAHWLLEALPCSWLKLQNTAPSALPSVRWAHGAYWSSKSWLPALRVLEFCGWWN